MTKEEIKALKAAATQARRDVSTAIAQKRELFAAYKEAVCDVRRARVYRDDLVSRLAKAQGV